MKTGSTPLVTIAVPTCNRAASYLPVALESALAQQYPNLEILIGDNASSDDTPELVRRLGGSRTRYFRHSVNIGPNRNYNYLLQQAAGDYFLLLHDDDVIDADFVSGCIDAADGGVREGVIQTGVRVIDASDSVVREIPNPTQGSTLADFYAAWFSGRSCWYLVNTLFHTRGLKAAGGFTSPHGLAEDGFAIAKLARLRRTAVVSVKASFRVHGGENTIARPTRAALWGKEYLALLDCMCESLSRPEAERLRREGRRFFARLAYNRAALAASRMDRLRDAFEVLRLFHYACWPTHRSRPLRWLQRASGYARRRLLPPLAHTGRRIAGMPERVGR